MLNKKILAVAIAAGFTTNALATVDLDATASQLTTYGSEAIAGADVNADGNLVIGNTTTNGVAAAAAATFDAIVDVQATVGFTIGNGTSKYVRVNLTNAEFNDASVDLTIANGTVAVSQGGTAGDTFVIFEIAAGADIPAAATYIVEADSYAVSQTAASTIAVATYETAADAVNETNALYTDSSAFTQVASASTGTFASAGTATATVGSEFETFVDDADADADEETEASIGSIDANDLLSSNGALTPVGAPVVVGDVADVTTTVTLAGDVSFGNWFLSLLDNCTTNDQELVEASDDLSATSAAFDTSAAEMFVCVENTGSPADTISKGSYTIEMDDDGIVNNAGSIVYNTTTVEVPYLTTFADYNQRFYLINNGIVDSTYSFSFTTEDGVTATPGTAATGVIPAGEMIAIKSTDIVTLSGKTRTSATIEVEAEDVDFSAATQAVNLSDKSTDTTVLN